MIAVFFAAFVVLVRASLAAAGAALAALVFLLLAFGLAAFCICALVRSVTCRLGSAQLA